MTPNDMSNTLADKVAVHLNLPFELEKDLQLHSITAQMMVQIVDMTDNAILQEIINYAKENKICDVYLLDKNFVKEALEKQIPKKVTHEASIFKCCTCPNCKNVVDEFTDFNGQRVRVTHNNCKFCGQALDWSYTE